MRPLSEPGPAVFVRGGAPKRRRQRQGDTSVDNGEPAAHGRANEIRSDYEQPLEWGFDLNRQVDDSAEYATDGWTVIDDDEAMVVATERQRYQATQDAFPHLNDSATGEIPDVSIDTGIVQTAHAIALKEQDQASRQARRHR